MTLHCVAAGGFAISAEVIKLLFGASAFCFVLLHTVDYVFHGHVILVVSRIIVII